ncbi:MAG: divergent polysaccharide deacetylase family protein [Candidatus Omnitrophota bacterium]
MTRRRRRAALFAKGKGYRIAVEIILIIAILEGTFFIINHYRETRRKAARIEAVKPKLAPAKAAAARPQARIAKTEILPGLKPKIEPGPKPAAVLKPKAVTPVKKPSVPAGSEGKIAIVLDDWGYSLNNMRIVDEIKLPVTAAVLPNLKYSAEAADQLHKRGFEIILHLPMESQSKLGMERNTILTSMSEGEIRAIIEQGLENVIYARGVNNHMGSKATADRRVMEEAFGELNYKGLYFLDSAVTADSVSSDLARRMNVPFIKRDVFLDNRSDPEYIRGQFNKLKKVAKKNGFAVGIGHDRTMTLEILKEVMPELEEEGYRFVFVSELVEN